MWAVGSCVDEEQADRERRAHGSGGRSAAKVPPPPAPIPALARAERTRPPCAGSELVVLLDDRKGGSASATGPSRTQNQPDGETVRRVVRPLSAVRERPDGGDPPADQRQVQRRDRHATDDTPGGLASVRHGGGHDRRPADRDREMNGHRGSQQHRCTPLMWEQHRAGGAAPLQHVLASQQRPRRGGDRRTRRSSQPGRQRVAQESSSKTTPHTNIVSGPGLVLHAHTTRPK